VDCFLCGRGIRGGGVVEGILYWEIVVVEEEEVVVVVVVEMEVVEVVEVGVS
jgi:hypothetical protein